MPKSDTRLCGTCKALQMVMLDYRPRTAHYHQCDVPTHREIRADYAGLPPLVPASIQKMKRLYVRDGQINKPVGYICDQGHVELDDPLPVPKHVQIPVLPAKWVCMATGEVLGE